MNAEDDIKAAMTNLTVDQYREVVEECRKRELNPDRYRMLMNVVEYLRGLLSEEKLMSKSEIYWKIDRAGYGLLKKRELNYVLHVLNAEYVRGWRIKP